MEPGSAGTPISGPRVPLYVFTIVLHSSSQPGDRQRPLPKSWILETTNMGSLRPTPHPSTPIAHLNSDSNLLMSPCSHPCPLGPILHAVDKGVFIKDEPNQVTPWLKPSLARCTLNKTHLLTVARNTVCDPSPSNPSDCSFCLPGPGYLASLTSLCSQFAKPVPAPGPLHMLFPLP